MYEAASSPHSSGLPAKTSLELGEAAPPKDSNVYVDFFGAGAVMGEMGILQQTSRCASVECETDVQVHIPICIYHCQWDCSVIVLYIDCRRSSLMRLICTVL